MMISPLISPLTKYKTSLHEAPSYGPNPEIFPPTNIIPLSPSLSFPGPVPNVVGGEEVGGRRMYKKGKIIDLTGEDRGEERKERANRARGRVCCSYDENIPYDKESMICVLHYGDRRNN
jgi:hypothetical protein